MWSNLRGIHATHQITLEIVIIASKQTEDMQSDLCGILDIYYLTLPEI
jgi:hypothetical protein